MTDLIAALGPSLIVGIDLASEPDKTVYSCAHGHSELPCLICTAIEPALHAHKTEGDK